MTESLVKQRESEEDIIALFEETCDNLPENMIQQDMLRSDGKRWRSINFEEENPCEHNFLDSVLIESQPVLPLSLLL